VQVRRLDLGDLTHLRLGDLADLVPVGLTRSLLEADRLLHEDRRWRRLQDEGERLVGEDRDLDGQDRVLALRPSVELFAEGHDVDALRAERRPDRRSRIGLPRRNLELHETRYLFCHTTSCAYARRLRVV